MKCVDHIMAGVASVVGEFSKLMLKEKMRKWDESHLKKWLIREDAVDLMTLKYEEISIDEHYARLYGPRILVHEQKINEIWVYNIYIISYEFTRCHIRYANHSVCTIFKSILCRMMHMFCCR